MKSVTVTGLAELGDRLRSLNADMLGKVARQATGAGAGVIKRRAIERAPVAEAPYRSPDGSGELIQPGNIPANIIMKYIKDSGITSMHIVTVRGKKAHGYASRIASMHEFGTVKMPPNPFMRPAVDGGQSEVKRAMLGALQRGIASAERTKGGS